MVKGLEYFSETQGYVTLSIMPPVDHPGRSDRVILKTSMKFTKNAQPRLGLTGLNPEARPGDVVSRQVPGD